MKKILSLFILFAMTISLSSCYCRKTKTVDTDEYNQYIVKVRYADDYMPSIEQCGNYSSFLATYKKTVVIFEIYTVGLFLSYNEDEYNQQKEAILSSREFFNPEDNKLVSDCDAVIDGYNIQLVKQDYPLQTYKMGLLIGMDDYNKKICYLFYYDFDLDELDNLDSYVETYFNMP